MTWICRICNERHGLQFDSCWKCGASKLGGTAFGLTGRELPANDVELGDLAQGCLPSDEFEELPIVEAVIIGREQPFGKTAPASALSDAQTPKRRRNKKDFTPVPFLYRINRYFRRCETMPLPEYDFHSKMPFFMASLALVRTPPKSLEFIRKILERISQTIRNCGCSSECQGSAPGSSITSISPFNSNYCSRNDS